MRITIILASLLTFTFLSSCNFALAVEKVSTGSAKAVTDQGALEVGEALISPASSLYFLKALRERIELMFSSTRQTKAHRELEFAVRRLREVKSLIQQNRQDLIEETLERYKDHINQLKGLSATDENLQETLGESVARHVYVLQTLYNQINNLAAKRALRASIMGIETFISGLVSGMTDPLRQTLIDHTALRQMAGCQFLAGQVDSPDLNEPEKQILQEYVISCRKEAAKSGTIPTK